MTMRPLSLTRWMGAIAPVDVSLCGHAYTSASGVTSGSPAVPGEYVVIAEGWRKGALFVELANLDPNSPNTACAARSCTNEKVSASQRAVDPPLPSRTSYPSGASNISSKPDWMCPTRFFTGDCLCEVPRMCRPVVLRASSCSLRTFDGPEPNRPSLGRRAAGMLMVCVTGLLYRASGGGRTVVRMVMQDSAGWGLVEVDAGSLSRK